MKRYYYLTESVESVEQISNDLHAEGITDWNFHVLSKDEAGLYRRHINSATPWQELDILHSALRGAMIGIVLGLIVGGAVAYFAGFGYSALAVLGIVGAFFGTWVGGFVGMSHENYKIARFHDDIEVGKHLVMVDVHPREENRVRAIMEKLHPEAPLTGEDTTLVNPLEGHMGGDPLTVRH